MFKLSELPYLITCKSCFHVAEDIQWLTNLEVLILSNNLLRVSYVLICCTVTVVLQFFCFLELLNIDFRQHGSFLWSSVSSGVGHQIVSCDLKQHLF